MSKKIQGNAFLFLTAIIWGFAFVAQGSITEYMPPFMYNGIRMYLGTLSLLILIAISQRYPALQKIVGGEPLDENGRIIEKEEYRRLLLKSGVACGIIMFFAANTQQIGLVYTTASKTAFVTTLYIVLVPLMGIFLKHKMGKNTWIGVALATVGMYLLCITEDFTIGFGDFIVFVGAFFWGLQIIVLDKYVKKIMVMKIIAMQFLISGTMSILASPFLDGLFNVDVDMNGFMSTVPSILYVGILSTAGAATFQGLGQKYASPVTASIILSMESVFGAIFGYIFMHDSLSTREYLGCALMFIAILIVQTPTRKEREEKKALEKSDL
ncbi:MAG: DMT family transporter [Clostridiales bacterium]|nr:DMT family transporter [Clostridiales bacterium]